MVVSTPSYLNSENIDTRKYQHVIADNCVNKNSLVVIPTGLGKTIIAVLVAAKTLELYPEGSKIIVLAPTRPLIDQHYNTFSKFLTISQKQFCVLTGKTDPEKRTQIFNDNQILFYTPQTLRNDLVTNKYNLKNVCFIVFDEVHHAAGDYPYTLIADTYFEQNPDGNILGLTASPGSSKQKINALCDAMHIPLKNCHFRTREDDDVKEYIKPLDIFKVSVEMTELMRDVYIALKYLIEERLQYLSSITFLEHKGKDLFQKVIRKDLLKLNSELVELLNRESDKTGVYTALSINAQLLILYYMIELVEQQGLINLLDYLEEGIYKKTKKKKCSKAVKVLAGDRRIYQIYIELKKNNEYSPEALVHPKYWALEKVLLDEIEHNKNSKILVFVKFRITIKNLVESLKNKSDLRPVKFVGQASKSEEDKGLSQKQQIEILEAFRKGTYNILISTSVGEEGLDIAECDMVVFFDVVASEIRYIQRRGRTARHREGKVIILYTKATNDDIYMKIVLGKLKKMNVNLKSSQNLKECYSKKVLRNRISVENEDIEPDLIKSKKNEDKKEMKSKPHTEIVNTRENKENKGTLDFFICNSQLQNNRKTKPMLKEKGSPIICLEQKKECDIILSKLIPPKLGVRKALSEENIDHIISDVAWHVIMYNEVIIQIYNPKAISKISLLHDQNKIPEHIRLVIAIFDFIDFQESFGGEKQLLKRKIKSYENDLRIKIIFIDNYEELYFIMKNIVKDKRKER